MRHKTRRIQQRGTFESLEGRRLLTADLNGDGRVAFDDFVMLSASFGDHVPPFGTGADIDGDGRVGFSDFIILSNSFGGSVIEFERIESMEPTNPEKIHAAVTSADEWNELLKKTNPASEPKAPPVNFEESMLIFTSLGETNLGQWVEIEWVTKNESRIDVGYRSYVGGVQPPPGTHVSTSLIAIPTSPLPVYFVELETIPLP